MMGNPRVSFSPTNQNKLRLQDARFSQRKPPFQTQGWGWEVRVNYGKCKIECPTLETPSPVAKSPGQENTQV